MKLYNSTDYDYIAKIGGMDFSLNSGETIDFYCTENTNVELICLNKSSVNLDWLDIIIFHLFSGSSTITRLYTNYSFVITDSSVDVIKLGENDWLPKNQVNIKSCCAHANVANEQYSLSDIKKIAKKHKLLHLLVTSAWPVALVLLVLCFVSETILPFLFLLFLWLLLCGIPCINELKSFNKIIDKDFLNENLLNCANKRRAGDNPYFMGAIVTSKFTKKILGKMFKLDEDKK